MGGWEKQKLRKERLNEGNKKCHDLKCCRSLQEDLSSKNYKQILGSLTLYTQTHLCDLYIISRALAIVLIQILNTYINRIIYAYWLQDSNTLNNVMFNLCTLL